MKKQITALILASFVLTLLSCAGTYVVRSQPARPYYTRPVSPGVGYIWIEGDWVWQGGRYAWREGYWGRPRANRYWEPGRWEPHGNGWYWRRGHWH